MPRPEIVTVEGAITGTLHDGKNMIVLTEGKETKVARSSLPFLREQRAIKDDESFVAPEGEAPASPEGAGADDGKRGGAVPNNDERKAAAALYREALHKNPGPGWDADTILAKLAEATEAAKAADDAEASGEGAEPEGEESHEGEAPADDEAPTS